MSIGLTGRGAKALGGDPLLQIFDLPRRADPDYVTPAQLALWMGVCAMTIRRWLDVGLVETVRTPGGHRQVPVAAARQLLAARGLPQPEGLRTESEDVRRARCVTVLDRAGTTAARAVLVGRCPVESFDGIHAALVSMGAEPPLGVLLDGERVDFSVPRVLDALSVSAGLAGTGVFVVERMAAEAQLGRRLWRRRSPKACAIAFENWRRTLLGGGRGAKRARG